MPTLLIADDHPLFRAALIQAARTAIEHCDILEAVDFDSTLAQLEQHSPIDLVLLDLHMPGNHGLAGLASIRVQFPDVAVAVCSGNDDPRIVRRALDHGAAGFIPKRSDMSLIRTALMAILNCQIWLPDDLKRQVDAIGSNPADSALSQQLSRLTAQQFRVLKLVSEGLLNKQIAEILGVQERTVKAHVTAIFEKFGVRNRTQASLILRELILSEPNPLDS